MNETWKQWEGQVVDGRFRLQKYLGGSDHSMVFLTENEGSTPRQAAIKLIACDPERKEASLAEWSHAAALSHPNILQIFESGQCRLGNEALLYVVTEYAEESLADILPQRHLSAAEAQEMLPPLLNALAYLHHQSMVHGHLKPSNVMATGDQVKLSSDNIRSTSNGDGKASLRGPDVYDAPELAGGTITPAADVWSLGKTLSEVADIKPSAGNGSERPAGSTPDPLAEMVSHCLDPDPQHRWTVGEIAAWLNRSSSSLETLPVATIAEEEALVPPSPQLRSLSKWLGAAIVIAAVTLLAFVGLRSRHPQPAQMQIEQPSAQHAPQAAAQPSEIQQAKGTSPAVTRGTLPAPIGAPPMKEDNRPDSGTTAGTIKSRVLPEVSRSAQRTIQGHIRVDVKVAVDAAGNVVGTTLESRGPSEYFARRAREAAGRWTFSPAQMNGREVASEWLLRFSFGRRGTDVNPIRVAP